MNSFEHMTACSIWPTKSHTLHGAFIDIIDRMVELNPYKMDIVIPLITEDDNTVIFNANKAHKYTYTSAVETDVVMRYNYIHRSIIPTLDDRIIAEILYTLRSRIDRVYLQVDINDIVPIGCVEEFAMDYFIDYAHGFELDEAISEMRRATDVTHHIQTIIKPFDYSKCKTSQVQKTKEEPMGAIYDMNKLGVKLIENEMEYGHFTDDERIAIAGALGFEFIRVPYSQHYDSLKMFDDIYKEGDMVYIVYDTGREAYSSYMDGWGDMGTCDINVNIDACFDSILEPYVTEYFENIVLPDLPSNSDTLRSTMVKLLHKITECIPDYSDILISILVPGNTWHTIKYNMNAYPRYMHTASDPNSIIVYYDSIEFKKVNKISIELVTEILYTIVCAIDHVRVATEDGVEQIICAEHVKMDAIDAYLDSLDPNLPDMIVEARKGYVTEKDAFDPIMKAMLDE